jgi:peptidoglycan/LPS O-acetylase OafA/YrhL
MPGYLAEIKRKLYSEVLTVPDILNKSNYRPLDGLRGVAILLVVFYHFGVNHLTQPYHIIFESRIGVNLFFVISGFLITMLLIKEKIKTGKISLRHFLTRRALRIIPVLYLFLIVLIFLNFYYDLKIFPDNFITSFLFIKNLPLHLHNHFLTAHLWTLAVEVQFYVTFPFLLAANINKYFITALSIIIIVPLVSILGFYFPGFYHMNFLVQFGVRAMMYTFWNGPVMILIGSVFSILVFKGMFKGEWIGKTYFLGIFLLIMAIVIQSRTFIYYQRYVSEYLSALLLAYCTVLCIKADDLLAAVLKSRVLVQIGILSYSIYIWQELFIGVRHWEPWLGFARNYPSYLFSILRIVCMVTIASASYYLYESGFLKLKKRFK